MTKIRVYSLLIVSVLLVAGCAQEPADQVTAAQQAVDKAKSKEAETYAASDYRQASEALSAAQAEIAAQDQAWFFNRDYGKAAELLTQAEQAAETAETAAQANKEQARLEAESALSQAEQALAAAESALQKAPTGKGTKADIEALKADLTAALTSLSQARQSFEASKYFEAKTQLNAVLAKAQAISADVEQASAKTRRSRRG